MRRVADEVDDVAVDRSLPTKARAEQAMTAQLRPQYLFGIRRISAEGARIRSKLSGDRPGGLVVSHRHLLRGDAPTPALPRKRERESDRPGGEIGAPNAHELSPPAKVGTSSGLKP